MYFHYYSFPFQLQIFHFISDTKVYKIYILLKSYNQEFLCLIHGVDNKIYGVYMELLFYNNLNYIYIKISDVFRFKERACDPYHETSHCSTGKNFNCEEFSPFSTNLFSTFFAFIVQIQLPLFPIFCTIPFLEFTFILSKFSP